MAKYLLLLSFIFITGKINAQVNLDSGLIAYYPFSGNFHDASGNGNNGTVMGGVTLTADQWGNANSAASFDGTSGWVSVDASPQLTVTKHFSIAYRFKTNSTNGQYLMSKSDYVGTVASTDLQYQINFNYGALLGSNGLVFGTMHNDDCQNTIANPCDNTVTGNEVQAGEWYCVVMTFDSGFKNIYVDGSLAVQETVPSTYVSPTQIDSCEPGTLRLGAWWQNDPEYFNGIMDEVRIYNRKLSIGEIDSMCTYVPGNNTSVNNVEATQEIALYPNPVINELKINLIQPVNNGKIVVQNELGQTLFIQQIDGASATINTSSLASGIYMVQILGANSCVTKRFIKE